MQQTNQPVPYETLLKEYAQETHMDQYRQKHFQQWCSDANGCSYCVSQGAWPFFGFIPRPNQSVTLCVAVSHHKDFFYLKIPTADLQIKVEGQKKFWGISHQQPWQDSLLDFAVACPLFLQQLPWKLMPGSLELWDEDRTLILVAQLARPLGKLGTDPEMELSGALFDFLDKAIIRFMLHELQIATIGKYRFLWESRDAEECQMRMRSLEQHRGLVPRFLVEAL
ncbi:hypothetical protein [Acidithiobacillus concretivorus]|uniref:Suppressor of fused-like domain-containing protein n=1 Tax=Acidithiobacillus concretivorus TaxID=3063952 RepID=A0ABS5ZTZ7_9PROT|nr:hypothetical protein [Acidithiobacillus concretivorus]MBU2739875.1 hypothetical protein [Acidithiobacillus concretivorus]